MVRDKDNAFLWGWVGITAVVRLRDAFNAKRSPHSGASVRVWLLFVLVELVGPIARIWINEFSADEAVTNKTKPHTQIWVCVSIE